MNEDKPIKNQKMKKAWTNTLKNRKAQFYILTAILIIAFSTAMVQANRVVPPSSKNFKQVFNNYAFESNKAANNAIFEHKDIDSEYKRFLNRFIDYARMKKLSLEVFAIIAHEDRIYFVNKMEVPVEVLNLNQVIPPEANTYFIRNTTDLVLRVPDDVFHENIYKLTLPESETETKAVLRVKKGSKTEIFVKE